MVWLGWLLGCDAAGPPHLGHITVHARSRLDVATLTPGLDEALDPSLPSDVVALHLSFTEPIYQPSAVDHVRWIDPAGDRVALGAHVLGERLVLEVDPDAVVVGEDQRLEIDAALADLSGEELGERFVIPFEVVDQLGRDLEDR